MRLFSLALVFALAFTSTSRAQLEGFTGVAPGSYASFAGFTAPGGIGAFSRLGLGGLLLVDNGALFPPSTGPNAMFGRGVDVQFRLQEPRKRFFGQFRALTFITTPPTVVRVRFFLTSFTWTPWMALPINTSSYTNGFWDVAGMFGQGYWAAQLAGNGTLPGYVGMDNLIVF